MVELCIEGESWRDWRREDALLADSRISFSVDCIVLLGWVVVVVIVALGSFSLFFVGCFSWFIDRIGDYFDIFFNRVR